jgi:hypothetical protein
MRKVRFSTSLRLTVPLILLGFAATLRTVNLMYHVPQASVPPKKTNASGWGRKCPGCRARSSTCC